VSIRGAYWGTINADRVELLRGSQVHGALHVNSFYMDEGVALHAEVNIQGTAPAKAPVAEVENDGAPIPVIRPSEGTAS
jgi:cytoskeletal protein CcmA (bactofilin family)